MKKCSFVVYGDIGDINGKIFKRLRDVAIREEVEIGKDAIEEAGGIPIGVRIENNLLTFDEETNLLRAEVRYELK
ncbi:MAG: hypothetical protein UT90_C0002G0032 [Parcubacteria group bacterium GW2011_GWA1_40_21]|nr:MAG: hypothetical protein UT80_C0001G0025 [Parcubacteria group bacterium GW2011_GWC1_40_13]KKR54075.1 MAG: hypothetical protein UT90_C0002G0032 [Parcubacteria group bacterium GW2011_GWA1_40_21]